MWELPEKMHALFSAGFDPTYHHIVFRTMISRSAMKIVSDGNCGKIILEFEVD